MGTSFCVGSRCVNGGTRESGAMSTCVKVMAAQTQNATRRDRRLMRHKRIRKTLNGDEHRPRLSVFRSNKEIYAQVIDDTKGVTLASASSLAKDIRAQLVDLGKKHGSDKESAALVGKALGERCKEAGITLVSFDRGGYKYHGRVAALADGAREAGLDF